MSGTAQDIGVKAEDYTVSLLRSRKMSVKAVGKGLFDLLADGLRVEVKVARKHHTEMRWNVNIHRHNVLNESSVDVYVVLLDLRCVGKKKPLVLLYKAPLGCKRLTYSMDSLLTIDHPAIENWSVLGGKP